MIPSSLENETFGWEGWAGGTATRRGRCGAGRKDKVDGSRSCLNLTIDFMDPLVFYLRKHTKDDENEGLLLPVFGC